MNTFELLTNLSSQENKVQWMQFENDIKYEEGKEDFAKISFVPLLLIDDDIKQVAWKGDVNVTALVPTGSNTLFSEEELSESGIIIPKAEELLCFSYSGDDDHLIVFFIIEDSSVSLEQHLFKQGSGSIYEFPMRIWYHYKGMPIPSLKFEIHSQILWVLKDENVKKLKDNETEKKMLDGGCHEYFKLFLVLSKALKFLSDEDNASKEEAKEIYERFKPYITDFKNTFREDGYVIKDKTNLMQRAENYQPRENFADYYREIVRPGVMVMSPDTAWKMANSNFSTNYPFY